MRAPADWWIAANVCTLLATLAVCAHLARVLNGRARPPGPLSGPSATPIAAYLKTVAVWLLFQVLVLLALAWAE